MRLSEHFSVSEAIYSSTAVRLGISNIPNPAQLKAMVQSANKLEILRNYLNKPISITSWFRSNELNNSIGGTTSKFGHVSGYCIDCRVDGYSAYDLCKISLNLYNKHDIPFDQIIHEFGSWMHISFNPRYNKDTLTIMHPEKKYKQGILSSEEYTALK